MRALRTPDDLFPANEPGAIARFWSRYWFWFFALLPWMLLRQLAISIANLAGAIWTGNRRFDLMDGKVRLLFMAGPRSLLLTTIFGERFTAIHHEDVLIDPGPPFARGRLRRYLETAPPVRAIVATHAHEEHAGNAALASAITKAPVYGSRVTLDAIRSPEHLPISRRSFMGQPEPATGLDFRTLGDELVTPEAALTVIPSPGHCEGHESLLDRSLGILFAGDSFLHAVFTSPNRDMTGEETIATLEGYLRLDFKTMIGTHGVAYTIDNRIRARPFVVRRQDPRALIADKIAFMRWAQGIVREGERRGLPYSVIEACLFPWQRWWSWKTWFTDEGGRLFSCGEFSRTHFVRSLASTPERVPPRFPRFARLVERVLGSRV
jgi:hydroxyacylglutathione hydrolase